MGEANAVKKNNFIQMLMRPQVLVYVILIIMLIIANIVSPGYLKGKHLLSMLRIAAFLGIVCIGQNLVILIGGIDMGVPYVIMIGNVIGAEILKGQDSNIGKALVAVILAGAIIGIIESIGINYFKINAFIMTLGMGIIVEGVAMVTTGGAPKGSSSPMLTKLTSMNTIGGISGIIIIWVIVSAIFIIVMKYTKFGRYVYALGANSTGARFSGVHTKKIRALVYIVSPIVCAFVGFMLVGYTGTTYLEVGDSYDPSNIAAVILGGTAVTGGRGSYVGTIAGVLIMTILTDFLAILNVNEAIRTMVNGIVLIVLLIAYSRNNTKDV